MCSGIVESEQNELKTFGIQNECDHHRAADLMCKLILVLECCNMFMTTLLVVFVLSCAGVTLLSVWRRESPGAGGGCCGDAVRTEGPSDLINI